MTNLIPLTKRDIEANYAPKLVNLPEGSTPYLMLAVVGFLSLAWSPFVTAGIAFLCWEGLAPSNVDPEKLSETESLILDLLEDQHPVTGETLNRVMRDIIGKCQGDRSIPSQLMAELAQRAYLDPSTNHYSIDHAGKRVHITTFAELRFCELFAEHTGRRLAPVQAPIILGDSNAADSTAAYALGVTTQLNAISVDASTVANPTPTAPPTNAAELLAALETQCPDLLLLVKSAPIRLVGKQRTGKSTFARKLAMLRSILLPGHAVVWATPHREADNPVPEGLNPFGTTADGAKDFRAIERVWKATQSALDHGQQLKLTALWDEFGGYDAFEDEDALGKSLKSMLREASKHDYYPILIAHGDQSSFYPGVRNILGTLHSSTVKVETIGRVADSFGTMKPTGGVEVTQLDGSVKQFTVPEWLTEELLLSLQPTVVKPAVLAAIDVPMSVVDNRAVIGTPSLATVPPEPEFKAADTEAAKPDDAVKRIGLKLAEKLKASGTEWVNLRDLIKGSFSSTEDRDLASKLLLNSVKSGKLEYSETENANKTKSKFVRVKVKV